MAVVTTFDPIFFGAVVNSDEGDARIMCMVQNGDETSLNIHFFKIDSSMSDLGFSFSADGNHSFQDELRGTGLAVSTVSAKLDEAKEVIVTHLREAYGVKAKIIAKQIEKPSLVSLFI